MQRIGIVLRKGFFSSSSRVALWKRLASSSLSNRLIGLSSSSRTILLSSSSSMQCKFQSMRSFASVASYEDAREATAEDSILLTESIKKLLLERRVNEAAYLLNSRIVGSNVDNDITSALLSQCVSNCLWDDAIEVAFYMIRRKQNFPVVEFSYVCAAMLTTPERVSDFLEMLRLIIEMKRFDLEDAINFRKIAKLSATIHPGRLEHFIHRVNRKDLRNTVDKILSLSHRKQSQFSLAATKAVLSLCTAAGATDSAELLMRGTFQLAINGSLLTASRLSPELVELDAFLLLQTFGSAIGSPWYSRMQSSGIQHHEANSASLDDWERANVHLEDPSIMCFDDMVNNVLPGEGTTTDVRDGNQRAMHNTTNQDLAEAERAAARIKNAPYARNNPPQSLIERQRSTHALFWVALELLAHNWQKLDPFANPERTKDLLTLYWIWSHFTCLRALSKLQPDDTVIYWHRELSGLIDSFDEKSREFNVPYGHARRTFRYLCEELKLPYKIIDFKVPIPQPIAKRTSKFSSAPNTISEPTLRNSRPRAKRLHEFMCKIRVWKVPQPEPIRSPSLVDTVRRDMLRGDYRLFDFEPPFWENIRPSLLRDPCQQELDPSIVDSVSQDASLTTQGHTHQSDATGLSYGATVSNSHLAMAIDGLLLHTYKYYPSSTWALHFLDILRERGLSYDTPAAHRAAIGMCIARVDQMGMLEIAQRAADEHVAKLDNLHGFSIGPFAGQQAPSQTNKTSRLREQEEATSNPNAGGEQRFNYVEADSLWQADWARIVRLSWRAGQNCEPFLRENYVDAFMEMLGLMKQAKVELPPTARTFVLLFLMENKPDSSFFHKTIAKMRFECETLVDSSRRDLQSSNFPPMNAISGTVTGARDCAMLTRAIQQIPLYLKHSDKIRPVSCKPHYADVRSPYLIVNDVAIIERWRDVGSRTAPCSESLKAAMTLFRRKPHSSQGRRILLDALWQQFTDPDQKIMIDNWDSIYVHKFVDVAIYCAFVTSVFEGNPDEAFMLLYEAYQLMSTRYKENKL